MFYVNIFHMAWLVVYDLLHSSVVHVSLDAHVGQII